HAHAVRHKLTRPYRPQTNGMAERFNRRLGDALARHPRSASNAGKNRFDHHAERNAFIQTFVNDYNRTRLRCLGHKAPAELLANLPGHNTFAGMTLKKISVPEPYLGDGRVEGASWNSA